MLYLDLAELPFVLEGTRLFSADQMAVAQFRRSDHHGSTEVDLDTAIRQLVHERIGRTICGPIRILTQPAYFGFCFNPVSFYYCYDERDQRVETIVAEVSNTPWNEQHCYVLPVQGEAGRDGRLTFSFDKEFHVSPFLEMGHRYDWRFSAPSKTLAVHTVNYAGPDKLFDATLALERQPLTAATFRRALLRQPVMTARIVAAIYWQALRLWIKGVPYVPHPRVAETSGGETA